MHVMAHAVDGESLFEDDEEREKFIGILRRVKDRRPFLLLAVCLMGTHLHLLIRTGDASLKDIMRDLLGPYSQWCNRKRGRRGHLFSERNKQILCANDAYLLELLRYIHMNPVDAGLCTNPADWLWSSHRAYLGGDDGGLVDTDWVLSLFHPDRERAREAFASFVTDRNRRKEDPFAVPPSRTPVWKETPAMERPHEPSFLPLAELCAEFCEKSGVPEAAIRGRLETRGICNIRHGFIRAAVAQGHAPRPIAELLNRTPEAVRKVLRKVN